MRSTTNVARDRDQLLFAAFISGALASPPASIQSRLAGMIDNIAWHGLGRSWQPVR